MFGFLNMSCTLSDKNIVYIHHSCKLCINNMTVGINEYLRYDVYSENIYLLNIQR